MQIGPVSNFHIAQPEFNCSNLTKETLQQGVNDVLLVSLLLTLNIFHTLL